MHIKTNQFQGHSADSEVVYLIIFCLFFSILVRYKKIPRQLVIIHSFIHQTFSFHNLKKYTDII